MKLSNGLYHPQHGDDHLAINQDIRQRANQSPDTAMEQ